MSIVFAGAPVVNALVSLWLFRHEIDFSKVSPLFYLGIPARRRRRRYGRHHVQASPAPQEGRGLEARAGHHCGPRSRRARATRSASTMASADSIDRIGPVQEAAASRSPFQQERLQRAGVPQLPANLGEFQERVPFTRKADLVAEQAAHPPYGRVLIEPLGRFTRIHQTSGTTGALRWLDTPESWEAMVQDWMLAPALPEWFPGIGSCSPSASVPSSDSGSPLRRRSASAHRELAEAA